MPTRPGVNAARLAPKPPQDKKLRPLFTGVERMQDNLHEVSLDDMFKTYLKCGGASEPTEEDLDAFEYCDEAELKEAKEIDLGPMICLMGKSVVDRAGERFLVRDISGSRPRSSKSLKRKPTDDDEDSEPNHSTSPHVAVYRNNDRTTTLLVITPEHYNKGKKTKGDKGKDNDKDKDKDARQDWVAHRSWSDIVAFFEAKVYHKHSAFEFTHPKNCFMRDDTDYGEKALDQFLEYLAQILAHQHRTHLFTVYIYRNQARIVYADCSGAVVSEPFPYGTRENSKLHVFFWKLARMSDKELGFDETATLATDVDVRAMREYVAKLPTDYLKEQAYYALSWDPNAKAGKQLKSIEWPMHKLSVGDRMVFVGRPSFATHSLFGRCTRGYAAFEKVQEEDKTSWHIRFLKDSWRVNDADGRIRPEHEVYQRLHDRGVRDNVPTCLAAGDVPVAGGSPQLTKLHDVGERSHHPRCHYRILISEMCRPLSDFCDFCELAALLKDALQAHKDAWEKAGVLHRDVSFNNILIYEVVSENKDIERKGILSDWDLSKYREDMSTGTEPRQPDRTGTWYFRSAVLGRYPRKPYEASDDIESFIHVYHYAVLRFHKTNMTSRLTDHFSLIYEDVEVRPEDGAHLGSISKFQNMCSPTSFIEPTTNLVLQAVLHMFADLYSQHYAAIDKVEYGRMYEPVAHKTGAAGEPASEQDQDDDEDSSDDEEYKQLLAAAQRNGPSVVAKTTLKDHSELLDLLTRICSLKWKKRNLSKSAVDLFKVAGLAPRKNNGFSSSMSRDSPPVQKKRKANTGSVLPSVDESRDPSSFEG